MPPASKESPLVPLDARTLAAVPVNPGERVALLEDHPDHPGRYGLIKDIGIDLQADQPGVRVDVWVFDPVDGVVDYEKPTLRLTLAEIQ